MEPSLLLEDGHSAAAAAAAGNPPSASPPVTARTGAIAMRIYNNASAIQVCVWVLPEFTLACMHAHAHAHLQQGGCQLPVCELFWSCACTP